MQFSLKGIYLLESDSFNDIYTWAFPQVDPDIVSILKARSGLTHDPSIPTFTPPDNTPICHRYKNYWIYTLTTIAPKINNLQQQDGQEMTIVSDHRQPTKISLNIIVDSYNPPAHISLLETLTQIYIKNPNTTTLLQGYLNASSTNTISLHGFNWDLSKYDQRMALIQPTHNILIKFGVEAIIIYIAVLLKKKIFVTSNDSIELSNFVRSLVTFGGWHRKEAQINSLRPIIASLQNPLEFNDIKNTSSVIAGIITPYTNIERYESLWDVHVDLTNISVSVNNNAKQFFAMTKFHKQIADYFLNTLNDAKNTNKDTIDTNEGQLALSQVIIKAVMLKTKEIVELANKCKGDDGKVSMSSIKEKELVPGNLEGFIYNVANAEGLV
jgi:hypothetical protein